MHWKIKASLQKILSTGRLGDRINHLYGSLKKDYNSNGVDYAFKELLFKLKLTNNARINSALEFGTGYFIVQPIMLKLLGVDKIVSVDISRDVFYRATKKHIDLLLQSKYIPTISELSTLSTIQFNKLVNAIKKTESFDHLLEECNISYIAPYEFNDIDKLGIDFDFIFSQVVLEHIPPTILGELFRYSKKWLSKDGHIVHVVNFTDHFTNPGIINDKNISEFNFLQYSDRYWNYWAGNSIAYTNRLGYPFYYHLCDKNGLKVVKFIEQNYKKKILLNNQIHPDILYKYKKEINLDELTRVQRGTFLITHN